MKASLQKRTNTTNRAVTAKSQHVTVKRAVVVRLEKSGRFAGMSENLEKLNPVRIPGYKVRG